MIDGSSIRTPQIRITDTRGQDMELNPRPVDVPVTRVMGESYSGKDSQLDAAIRAKQIAGPGDAFLIGYSLWDCEAARRGGIPTVGVLTGGFSRSELEGAGARVVYEDLPELADHLNELLTRL